MTQQAILFGMPWRPILVDSADFDGTNDYMTRGAGLTGAADSDTGILSVWVRIDGGDGNFRRILAGLTTVGGTAIRFGSGINTSNLFSIVVTNTAAAISWAATSSAYTASSTWLHLLASWNIASAGNGHLYVNDVSDATVTTDLGNGVDADYTVADWSIGALGDGTLKMDGCLAELYFAPGQYLDFSTESNRRLFITKTLRPVSLGSDGSTPTSVAPLVYQRVAIGAAASTFATNLGGGGDFSITGTLTVGSTSPTT